MLLFSESNLQWQRNNKGDDSSDKKIHKDPPKFSSLSSSNRYHVVVNEYDDPKPLTQSILKFLSRDSKDGRPISL